MPFETATPVACDDPTHKAHEGCIKAPGGFVGEFLVLLALRSLSKGAPQGEGELEGSVRRRSLIRIPISVPQSFVVRALRHGNTVPMQPAIRPALQQFVVDQQRNVVAGEIYTWEAWFCAARMPHPAVRGIL